MTNSKNKSKRKNQTKKESQTETKSSIPSQDDIREKTLANNYNSENDTVLQTPAEIDNEIEPAQPPIYDLPPAPSVPRGKVSIGWIVSIAITASLGLAISIYLTIHHYHIMSGLPEFQSFCSVSEYIDCDMVNTSTYSEFKGLPVALFGGGIYACIVCLIILSIFARGTILKRYISTITILGLISFCFSIYFAVVSTFILHAICILCVVTYVINLFIFIGGAIAACKIDKKLFGTLKTIVMPFTAEKKEITAIGNTLGVFVIIMVLIQGFFAALYLDAKYLGFTEKDIASFKEKYMAIKKTEIDLADSPYWGSDNPDLTIVVFEDFLCNFCRRSHVSAFPIFKEFKDRIKVVFKALPYDKDCHPTLQKTLHPGACKSSIAAACASLQGEFTRFQEYFFNHQNVINPKMDILKVAKNIGGIDIDTFKSCLDQGKGDWLVRRDFKEAMKLGVRRTPAYFFNGRKWEGALKPIFIKRILEWELKLKED